MSFTKNCSSCFTKTKFIKRVLVKLNSPVVHTKNTRNVTQKMMNMIYVASCYLFIINCLQFDKLYLY